MSSLVLKECRRCEKQYHAGDKHCPHCPRVWCGDAGRLEKDRKFEAEIELPEEVELAEVQDTIDTMLEDEA